MKSTLVSVLAFGSLMVALSSNQAAAGGATVALVGDGVYPESIAYDATRGALYVSGNGDGSVQVVKNGTAELLQPGGTDGRTQALGIKVDAAHDRVWLVDGAAVYIYSLSTNALVRRVPLADVLAVESPGLNDLALDAEGNAYITESFHPYLLRVDGRSLELSVFRDLSKAIPYGTQNDFPYNLNGIVLAPDGLSLIAVKTNEGTLWRIDLTGTVIREIKLQEPVTKGDGLVWGPAGALFVVRNFENKISRIDLAHGDDLVPRPVATFTPPELRVPTSAVYLDRPVPRLALVNSQFDKDQPVLPFQVVEVQMAALGGAK